MIARTEVVTASNFAEVEAYDQSGVVEAKEWWTSPDERLCPQCSAMHGKQIAVKDDFFKKGETFQGLKLDYRNIG